MNRKSSASDKYIPDPTSKRYPSNLPKMPGSLPLRPDEHKVRASFARKRLRLLIRVTGVTISPALTVRNISLYTTQTADESPPYQSSTDNLDLPVSSEAAIPKTRSFSKRQYAPRTYLRHPCRTTVQVVRCHGISWTTPLKPSLAASDPSRVTSRPVALRAFQFTPSTSIM